MNLVDSLFISKKSLPIPPETDNPQLNEWMKKVHEHFHTSNLDVEKWANTQPFSASGFSSTPDVVAPGVLTSLTIDSTHYDPGHMVDVANSQIVLPREGIYLFTGRLEWVLGLGDVGFHNFTIGTTVNGGAPVASVDYLCDFAINSEPRIIFAFQSKGQIRDTIRFVVLCNDITVNSTVQVEELTVTMIGRIPSVPQ